VRRIFFGLAATVVPFAAYACGSFESSGDGASDASDEGATSEASTASDATTAGDAELDGGARRCKTSAKFGTPRPLDGVGLNTQDDERMPRLSPDESILYFERIVAGTTNAKLFTATRTGSTGAFGTPGRLPLYLSDFADDHGPSVASDGKTLYFGSSRSTFTPNIWQATRSSTSAEFASPSIVPSSAPDINEGEPFITADDAELYFTRQGARYDLFVARRSEDAGFVEAGAVEGVSVPNGNTTHATPSADGLTLYFARQVAGAPDYDIWMATRATRTANFTVVGKIAEVSSDAQDGPGWISPDDCRLYFERSSGDGGTYDLWVAERLP
jgi:hypothetical protein